MLYSPYKAIGVFTMVLALVTSLAACKPRNEPVNKQEEQKVEPVSTEVPTVLAKVVMMQLPNAEVCEQDECTKYQAQTVETNLDWINQYFVERIHQAEPVAFTEPKLDASTVKNEQPLGLSQSSTVARYLNQFGNVATFAIDSYSYAAGAAHGMYHTEYVNFALKQQKRLSLKDIVLKGKEQDVLNQLYDENALWLENHVIERANFKLSDNFYYGVNGIVFVYPLYELASYAEGMTELTLSYRTAKALFKPEFMPSLPEYSND